MPITDMNKNLTPFIKYVFLFTYSLTCLLVLTYLPVSLVNEILSYVVVWLITYVLTFLIKLVANINYQPYWFYLISLYFLYVIFSSKRLPLFDSAFP